MRSSLLWRAEGQRRWHGPSFGAGLATAVVTLAFVAVPFSPGAHAVSGCTSNSRQISTLSCSEILVTAPYQLGFSSDAGKLVAGNGVGTGFTMVDPPTNGVGYQPQNLLVSTVTPGTLAITTDKGIAWLGSNAQQNALGVGIHPGRLMDLTTTLVNPPLGSGGYEQAGLWWGNDEDNYVKLVVISKPGSTGVRTDIQLAMELTGGNAKTIDTPDLPSLAGSRLALTLHTDPASGRVTGAYTVNGGAPVTVGTLTPPAALFSADAAGIDPTIGTNTFGGVFATHRSAAAALQYRFDNFTLQDVTPITPPPPPGSPTFQRFSIGATVSSPTAMAFGPDGRLYVTELLGKIHALTLGSAHLVTADQVITNLGSRLTTGLTIDPASTATNVILWVSHSDPDLAGPDPTTGAGGGAANSSAVAKITVNPVSRTAVRATPDPITGLPRSQANHTINAVHFGPVQPDGRRRLFIAVAGNTGAGAPNNSTESLGEFGLREEQPLSAAILEADVFGPGFDGSCANPTDIYAAAPCSVTTFGTGLRNSYDFVWHSDGSLYATENGASVGPTYPRSPTAPCAGLAPYPANDPGDQNDFLYRVQRGHYYGHPDPHRLPTPECVFKNGSLQGVPPLSTYQSPIADLGPHKSADGIIEYRSSAFGGAMRGNLLITNYSIGDDITRVVLSADGTSVVSRTSLVTGFTDPLPLVEGPDGTIYVGEFSAKRITALVPDTTVATGPGTWTTKAPMPLAILDAGGAALGGKLYAVGGKTSASHLRSLYVYDPATNAWSAGPALPAAYPAVENPAVVPYNGKLYVFGGSTAAFSGAVASAAVFDPSSRVWTMLASMPIGLGGAAAEAIGSTIYVAGGMGADGASVNGLSIYNPATNSWSLGTAMSTRRDNPGSAALGGKLFVFGGRTRNADGTTPVATLNSVEAFDPATNLWQARAAMPTGRRTMAVGTINGRAQLAGGERSTTASGTFAQNEEYDPVANTWRALTSMPTPRHGSVAGTINSVWYVAGGGPTTGASYSAVTEAFSFIS
ncbi:MAG: large repetitive protein [Frankiales bacterium]|nr:large repetitive protein [Frankiales bacterium]